MPTYEYHCAKCDKIFEHFQSMKAEPLQTCLSCGGEIRRLISGGGGIIFKGSGFYQTDYRGKDYQKQSAADKPAGCGANPDTKSCSAPACANG